MQNNIQQILEANTIIPVVTINDLDEIKGIMDKLSEKEINCIEVTLRTPVSLEAISIISNEYGTDFSVGVGTIISQNQVQACIALDVDFMVSPGMSFQLIEEMQKSGIPFIPGVSTPSEIISASEQGCQFQKFFPANLFGGIKALKTYQSVFPKVKFCPTGGINEDNMEDYLKLGNVVSIGGSWLLK